MSRFTVYSRWLSRRRQQACQARVSRKVSFRPGLEALEARDVPSTLTVTNNSDTGVAGDGSLRGEIRAAHPSGDTIVFAPGLAGQTIQLTGSPLEVDRSLTIMGLGANKLPITISGNDASQVFHIPTGMKVTISGLTIAHGNASAGGGIDNAGTLTVRNCTLSNNVANGGQGGGGILNEVNAHLTLDHSILRDNVANAAANSDVFGGGLLNLGSATVSATTFRGDQALGGGSTTFFGGSVGGAIANTNGATLTVIGSTFNYNEVVSVAGPNFATGGAIENDAGLDFLHPSKATLSGCTFVGNVATGGDGVDANGGAIDNQGGPAAVSAAGQGATMILSGCLFVANQAIGGPNGTGTGAQGEGEGGGVMNAVGSTMTVTSCTLIGNQAVGGDHSTSVVVYPSNPPAGPAAGIGVGGGLLNGDATMTVTNCTLTSNVARGGETDAGPGAFAAGGGIENWGKALSGIDGILHVNNCLLQGNQAIAGHGGPGDNTVPNGFASGGGIDTSFSGITFVTGSRLIGNVAIGGNGGSGVSGGTASGGGIGLGYSSLFGLTDNASITIRGSILEYNLAFGGTGGSGKDGGTGQGGGLSVTTGSSATVNGSTIKFNQAVGGLGGSGGSNGQGLGGGVYHQGGTFVANPFTLIALNFASTNGDNIFP